MRVSAVDVCIFARLYKPSPFILLQIFLLFFSYIHSLFLFISCSYSFLPHFLLRYFLFLFFHYKFSTYYLYKIQPLGSFFPHAGSYGSTARQMLARSLRFFYALLTLATNSGGRSFIHSYEMLWDL